MITLLGKIWEFFSRWNPMVRFWAALTSIAVAVVTWFSELWDAIFEKVDSLMMGSFPAGLDFSPLALMNYIIPLDLLFSYLIAYGALLVVASVIRIIKSFVPTIS